MLYCRSDVHKYICSRFTGKYKKNVICIIMLCEEFKRKVFIIVNRTKYLSYESSAALYELSFVFENRTDHVRKEKKMNL